MATAKKALIIPILLGGIQFILTLNLPRLSVMPENAFLAGIKYCAVLLLLPGMIGAMAIEGNVHAWRVWLAAPLNGIIYFGFAWALTRLVARLFRSKEAKATVQKSS